MDISSSPRLIAGYRVLLRLSVPRHSPYALFRLNSRFAFLHNSLRKQIQLFCLSFANNCLGCKLKRPIGFIIHVSLSTWRVYLLLFGRNCFGVFTPPTVIRKNLLKILLTSFSQYTTICFVSLYFIRFSMSICASRSEAVENWKLKVESWKLLHFPFSIFHFQLQALGLLGGDDGIATLARTARSVIRGSDDYQSSFTTAPTSNPKELA